MGSVRDHMPDMTDPSTATRVNRALVALCVILALVAGWALATRSRASTTAAPTYWVAPDGDDAASGSESAPWATLQHAADAVSPGATVEVRGGTYAQRVSFHVSGTPGAPITFEAAPGESVVLDGSSLEVPSGQAAMIEIDSQRYLTIQGFQITGWGSDESGHVPIGILVTGSADHVRIAGNTIHDMGTTFQGRSGGDAHGIGVFGTTPDHPIDGVEIVDNELANLTLGSSEALVVNGNVQNFTIEGNRVHDTNNIGIDVIGFEGTAPDPTVDQARDGVVRGNEVWNVDSYGNPAYGYDRSADGIYVDGGRDVLVEGNVVHDVNIGIEMASEHAGRSTRNITTRNNVVYDATAIGIAIGGYDRKRGSTEDCTIVNNTVVDTKGPELLVQFDTRGNTIANNIFVAGRSHDFVENAYTENVDNVVDANLYYADDGDPHGTWQWKAHDYGDFTTLAGPLRRRPARGLGRSGVRRPVRARLSRRRHLARRGRGVAHGHVRHDRSRRHPSRAGSLDRHRRLRGRAAPALADAVDRRTRHVRGRAAVPAYHERLGRSGGRPQQRGARARRRRADPDRHVHLRARDRRPRALEDRARPRRPVLDVPRRRRRRRGGRRRGLGGVRGRRRREGSREQRAGAREPGVGAPRRRRHRAVVREPRRDRRRRRQRERSRRLGRRPPRLFLLGVCVSGGSRA